MEEGDGLNFLLNIDIKKCKEWKIFLKIKFQIDNEIF